MRTPPRMALAMPLVTSKWSSSNSPSLLQDSSQSPPPAVNRPMWIMGVTLADSQLTSTAPPKHTPGYRIELGGQGDLVLQVVQHRLESITSAPSPPSARRQGSDRANTAAPARG